MNAFTTPTIAFVVAIAILNALLSRYIRDFGLDMDLPMILRVYPVTVFVAAAIAGVLWFETTKAKPAQVTFLLMAIWLVFVGGLVLLALDGMEHRTIRLARFGTDAMRGTVVLATLVGVFRARVGLLVGDAVHRRWG